MENNVVIYQSNDGLVKMEAIVDASNETIWATQKAMAQLFGVTVPNISYHFKRIFASGELDAQTVIKEILITAQSGVRGVSEEKIRYYNLDAILSLGYRVTPYRQLLLGSGQPLQTGQRLEPGRRPHRSQRR